KQFTQLSGIDRKNARRQLRCLALFSYARSVYSTTEFAPTAWPNSFGKVADHASRSSEIATSCPAKVKLPESLVVPTTTAGMSNSAARARTPSRWSEAVAMSARDADS